MKIKYILTLFLTVSFIASSCMKEEQGPDMSTNDRLFKVRLSVPDIEVKATSTPSFYAYLPSELNDGKINPIENSGTNKDGDVFYYSLPEDTEEVVFTPLCGNDGEIFEISTDEETNVSISIDTAATGGTYFFSDELLAGYVGDVVPGIREPYDVEIKRLSSKLTTNFRIKNQEGTVLNTRWIISSVKVEYSGLGDSACILHDNSVRTVGNQAEEITLTPQYSYDNYLYYNNSLFIPSPDIPSVTVTITRGSGITQTYTKSLGKKLEPNRHYTVNLSVTHINTGGTFEVNEPEVIVSTPVTPSVTDSEFFSVPNLPTLQPEAGSEVWIDVATLLPYEWTFELDEAAEKYFTVEKLDGKLKAVAKEENSGDFNFGNVTLKSLTGGYTKTFAIRQFSTRKHEIILTRSSSNSYSYIVFSGENITVQDPNDSSPRVFKTANSTRVEINGLSEGAVITVKGDLITDFIAYSDQITYYSDYYELHDGYYYYLGNQNMDAYSFEFKNCRYLETFYGNPRNSQLDFSGMPELKKVVLGRYSSFNSITFAEGQGVEFFRAYQCNNIQQLDLRNISGTLHTVKINDCDALLGANFKNFTKLSSVDLNQCSKMGSINLSGCTSLESFYLNDNSAASLNISDCSSLKSLEWTTSLETLIHEGADAIESVKGGYVSKFDFSGKTSLKNINGLGAYTFDVSDCINLESMGHIYSVYSLNVNNCPSLKTLDVDFYGSSGETYAFADCPNIQTVYFNNMTAECDFSPLTGVKNMYFTDFVGKSIQTVDLTANTELVNVEFEAYTSDFTLNKILLPNSVKNVILDDLRKLTSLDLSNHTNLEDVYVSYCVSLNDINFSGCSALKDLDVYYISNSKSCNLNLSGCSSLVTLNNDWSDPYLYRLNSVDFTGCSSLEYVNLYDGDISNLDFSDSPKLTYLDIRYNAMTKEAIDAMFISMPDWSVDDGFVTGAYMLSNNASGYTGYNKSAANAKNWWSIE